MRASIAAIGLPAAICLALAGCAQSEAVPVATAPDPAQITLGNGERNAISFDSAKRNGAQLTFASVMIERDGFLVMHPFRDGAPVRDEYVGSSFVPRGNNSDVQIALETVPETGDMFIVMLHFDMNSDGNFDFGDGVTVPDAPAFEGSRMIAQPFAAPPEN